ncbi:ORF6N domain-containing protein [Vibrio fluvialis]|nr:ORF6N domain-containing protein [Vibrio fluvialis]
MTSLQPIQDVSNSVATIVVYNGEPVVTTEMLANFYDVDVKLIQNNHKRNPGRFVENKHYIKLSGDELSEFKNKPSLRGLVGRTARHLTLWTERGAARHAKMLESDKAWEIFERLEDCYFNQKKPQEDKPKSGRVMLYIKDGIVTDSRILSPNSFITDREQLIRMIREPLFFTVSELEKISRATTEQLASVATARAKRIEQLENDS